MVQKVNNDVEVNKPAYMYYLMSKSGQCSPTTSDTLDSGTGSDLETTPTTNRNTYTLPTSLSLTNAVSKSMRKFNELSVDGGVGGGGGQRRLKSSHSSNDSYHTDSEESESSLSCDSLNSSEIMRMKNNTTAHIIRTSPFGSSASQCVDVVEPTEGAIFTSDENNVTKINFLPRSLLQDIRDRSMTLAKNQSNAAAAAAASEATNNSNNNTNNNTHSQANSEPNKTIERNDAYRNGNKTIIVHSHLKECNNNNNTSASYTNEQFNLHQQRDTTSPSNSRSNSTNFGGHSNAPSGPFNGQLRRIMRNTSGSNSDNEHRSIYENDKYINFHLNERMDNDHTSARATIERPRDDDSFAGYRDIRASSMASTIRSSKGTIRGVKNRVRNGIATFLQMQQTNVKVRLPFRFCFLL